MKAKFYQAWCSTPIILLVLTVTSIYLSELLVIISFPHHVDYTEEMVRGALHTLLIAPALYLLLYRPLMKSLKKSLLAEDRLTDLNRSLEERVAERTRALVNVNKLLETEYTEELRLSEERYKNVIDHLGVGVSVIDTDMKVISYNNQMGTWYPSLELCQAPLCYKAYVSEDTNEVCEDCPVQATFREGKISYLTIDKVIEGELRTHRIIASPVKDKQGNIVAVTEMVEDVTDQKKQQVDLERDISDRNHELCESETRYRSLVQNSAEGIFVFDPVTLKIQEANKQFLALLGYTQREIEGASLMDFVIADKDIVAGSIDQMVNKHNKVNVIRQYKRKDSSLIDVEVSGSVIQYGQSKVCLVNVHDITERKIGEEALKQSVEELSKTLYAGIDVLIYIVEKRDPYTAGHQKRVATLAVAIAKEMGLEDSQIETIRIAGILHDIGKIFIPSDILNKPGRLTDMEMGIIKTHPQASYEIIAPINFKTNVAEIVLQHHERIDGSGYPKGLKGKDISIGAKILGVVDVIEAMSSHRPYRPAIGWQSALQEIVDKKGILYDVDVVEACLRLADNQVGYLLQKIIEEVA